jgi:cellulose synthase/poly-beta-1,6-N-acetylglucosamine synthase-like glycosyltransferase
MGLAQQGPYVQVIVPARNEQDCIARSLDSLLRQQGISFQITVVNDDSSDQTGAVAASFAGVRVMRTAQPAPGVTGKCNALICGASDAQAEWLLFTDADTFHYPGSLRAAVKEAEERGVDLLSYSPEQEVVTWREQILMPIVFAELTRTYPPTQVNDPEDPVVAANGQYILVRRQVYEKLGGHQAVANKILEDVELARMFKRAGCRIWFGYGAGLVRTRMYRNFSDLVEGWTKNLAVLFPHPVALAAIRALEFCLLVAGLSAGWVLAAGQSPLLGLAFLLTGALIYVNSLIRSRGAHFSWKSSAMAVFGLPLFSFLLMRSYVYSRVRRAVSWKGRVYRHSETDAPLDSSID